MKFAPPQSFVNRIEAAGGFYKSIDPEPGTKVWVLIVEFSSSSSKDDNSVAEFLFPNQASAQSSFESTPPLTKLSEGVFATPLAIVEAKKYFHCSFCGIERRRARILLRKDDVDLSVSICPKCVTEFSAKLDLKKGV